MVMDFGNCPQLGTALVQVFPELGKSTNAKAMRWLKPDDTVATMGRAFNIPVLDANYKPVKVRNIPILEDNPGELKALVTYIDYRRLVTPPIGILPVGLLSDQEMQQVEEFITAITDVSISEAFPELFIGETERLSSGTNTFRDGIRKLRERQVDEINKISRRYRTLPVLNDNKALVGMLSYTNVLRKIQEHCERFLTKRVTDVYKKAEELSTLPGNKTLYKAAEILEPALFTHLPIMKSEGSGIVTGIVDDLMVATYQHPLLFDSFKELSLKEIQTPVTDENTVTPNNTVRDVIEKFLKITFPDRPTAILVCTKDTNGEFVLQGIVSYTDILKKFELWREGNIEHDREE